MGCVWQSPEFKTNNGVHAYAPFLAQRAQFAKAESGVQSPPDHSAAILNCHMLTLHYT